MPTHRLNEQADGVYIISATPFDDHGAIDFDSTDRLVDFYIDSGVTGMTILGMMGEAPKLSGEESLAFMRHVMKRVNGRVPVIVGVSNAGLDNLKNLSLASMEAGACGVMVAPNAALNTEDKLYNYYAQICSALGPDVPLCYQDFPLTTAAHISAATLNRMVRDMAQLVMLKHEDWPGLGKLSAVRTDAEKTGTRRISILVGNGGLYLPQELARGADGAMTGFAYPEMLVNVVKRYKAGDMDGAEDLFDAYLPLVRHEQQPGFGLAVRKEVLRRRGIIKSAAARAPGPKLDVAGHEELTRLMDRLNKKLAELGHGS